MAWTWGKPPSCCSPPSWAPPSPPLSPGRVCAGRFAGAYARLRRSRGLVRISRRHASSRKTAQAIAPPVQPAPAAAALGEPPEATRLILTIEDLTELRGLETVRRAFVSHVSHELRTPLAAVKLLAETLLRALDDDPAAARTFAERIGLDIDHLSQMVVELLELSRIESGKISLRSEPTDIAGLV